MDQPNLPLDTYLENLERYSEGIPTVDEVKAAIHAFCPLDTRTGEMIAEASVCNLYVLTRILYLPLYSELLTLLTAPIFVAKCLMDLERYLQTHKVTVTCPCLIVL